MAITKRQISTLERRKKELQRQLDNGSGSENSRQYIKAELSALTAALPVLVQAARAHNKIATLDLTYEQVSEAKTWLTVYAKKDSLHLAKVEPWVILNKLVQHYDQVILEAE